MKWFGLGALILVAGCIGEDDESGTILGSETCDPASFEFLIGQSKDVVDDIVTPELVRVLGENAPMTMDHRPERLNIFHDESGKIVKVSCG